MKKANMTINMEPAEDTALQYVSGLVEEPPSDEIGRQFLAWVLPKRYRMADNVLIDRRTVRPAERKALDTDKKNAKITYHNLLNVVAGKAKQAASGSENMLQSTTTPSTATCKVEQTEQTPAPVIKHTVHPDKIMPTPKNASVHDQTVPMAVGSQHAFLDEKQSDRQYQLAFLSKSRAPTGTDGLHSYSEEIRSSPLFSGRTLDSVGRDVFHQYGLLGEQMSSSNQTLLKIGDPQPAPDNYDPRVFFNVSEPCSAFICGSQGSGKSHTLSCILENCLVTSKLGRLSSPLRGIVFHYDAFTSYGSSQICEAAYLCSSGIPVRVLVAPTNFWRMKEAYEKLPGLAADARRPEVIAMKFQDQHLDSAKMMSMMAVNDRENSVPLYISVVLKILRDMAIESRGAPGLNYNLFREKVDKESLTGQQLAPLKIRLELLESFMDFPLKTKESDAMPSPAQSKKDEERSRDSVWDFEPGTLTIVDLSCPHVGESAACSLFSICLELFLESRGSSSQIVALDEAHKFMTSSASAALFTEKLLQVIRQQRHLATRVIIATQEPNISPILLDLSSITIVHRFTSPEWFKVLRDHLAGMNSDTAEIFAEIVELARGEALLFSPAVMLKVESSSTHTHSDDREGAAAEEMLPEKLGTDWAKIRVRMRLTEDGGKSFMAV